MIYCPKYKINIDNSECIHCEWNYPITFDWTTNCRHPIQLIWSKNFKRIIRLGGIE